MSTKPGFSLLLYYHLQVYMGLSKLPEHLRNAFKAGVWEVFFPPQYGKEKFSSPHALILLCITSFVPTSQRLWFQFTDGRIKQRWHTDQEHQSNSLIPQRLLGIKQGFKFNHAVGFLISHNDTKVFSNKIEYQIMFTGFLGFVISFSWSIKCSNPGSRGRWYLNSDNVCL